MNPISGKVTYLTLALGAIVMLGFAFADPLSFSLSTPSYAVATTATTTVTVLNLPPEWAVNAQESPASATSSPTNAGSQVTWIGTATDSNNEPYYMVVCSTSTPPTASPSGAPTCAGGAGNQWGVSSLTASNVQATTTYTTLVSDAEQNLWFAFICDENDANPSCNSTYTNGSPGSPTSSPFFVNHRPNFTSTVDSSPADPGAIVTWTTSSSDPDVVDSADTTRLFVCQANDFTGTACGAGGSYCTSTAFAANPTCSTTLTTPLQDADYTAYAFVIDNHDFAASGGAQATNTVLTVSNVAPSISSSSISLLDALAATTSLYLTVDSSTTPGFRVLFTATDNNSCSSSVPTVPEIRVASTVLSVYRSGVTQATCDGSPVTEYNPNNCYPSLAGTSTWNVSCVQDAGSCSGSSDPTATFTCTFPLWFLADPTDGSAASDTVYFAETWMASVRAVDDDSATSTFTESSIGSEMVSFLAFALQTLQIPYGSLRAGSSTDPLTPTTTVRATGNVGLDHLIYGTDMCVTFPNCPVSTTSTINITNQQYATSSAAFSSTATFSATSSSSTAPQLEINILKSTQTSSPAFGTTFWGIHVPISITFAGDYTGNNTIIGVKGEAQFW